MYNYYDLIKAEKRHQLLLAVIFILYILIQTKTPVTIAEYIDTPVGNIVVALLAISTFYYSNPIVGLLGLVAAYELVRRSKVASGNSFKRLISSESSKFKVMEKLNEDKKIVTLEEEMVGKMAPLVKHDASPNSNYKPILDTLHDAAPIDYDGVV
jgi:hypothetical protein